MVVLLFCFVLFFSDGQEHSWVLQNKLNRRRRHMNLKFPRTHCILHMWPALGGSTGRTPHVVSGLIKNNVGRCRHVPSPKYAHQEWKSVVCIVTFNSDTVASLSFCLYVTCYSMPVSNHRPLLPCFVDCHFAWKIKRKTNKACHFYSMPSAFGLGLPDSLGESILISVVSTVKMIISRKQNFSSFTGRNSAHNLIYLWLQESNKTGEGLFFMVKVMFDCCWILFMYF